MEELMSSIFHVFKIVIVEGEFDKQRETKSNVFIAKVVKLSLDNNYLKKENISENLSSATVPCIITYQGYKSILKFSKRKFVSLHLSFRLLFVGTTISL